MPDRDTTWPGAAEAGTLRASLPGRRCGGGRRRVAVLTAGALAGCAAVLMAVGTQPAAEAGRVVGRVGGRPHADVVAAPKPGKWTALGPHLRGIQGATPTLVTVSGDEAYLLFVVSFSPSSWNYYAALIGAHGNVITKAFPIFGPDWRGLAQEPTLVPYRSKALVVFVGDRSAPGSDPYSKDCVYGDLSHASGTAPWTLQPWSLSAACGSGVGSAASGAHNVVAAAWPGGWAGGAGILYRVGTSASIPASGTDGHIALTQASAAHVGVASDIAGNGHFYVAWDQVFSSSRDGYYVKDVTSGGPRAKAPGTGTVSTSHAGPFANLAITNTDTHRGVFIAYCSNTPVCHLRLWRVGTKHAAAVPGSANAFHWAVSAGPDGRIWVAWTNGSTNIVSVVRTNKADTVFGPVERYKSPCPSQGFLGLSGGNWGRVDVGLQCLVRAGAPLDDFVTQSVTALAVSPRSRTISNRSAHKLVFMVTDAGDPVKGAVVRVDGHAAKTGSAGRATITIPKGAKPGTFTVTASVLNYIPARGTLVIVR